MLDDHSISAAVQSFEDGHEIVHGEVHACLEEELLQLLVIDETGVLSVDYVEEVVRLLRSELVADAEDAQLALHV